MKVVIYANRQYGRSMNIASSMHEGFRRHGITSSIELRYAGPQGDLAVAYGWNHEHAFNAYRRAGRHFLYVDLGYWLRKPPGRPRDGYHKVSLDAWCPSLNMRRGCPGDRFAALGVKLEPWRKTGQAVVIAGMSAKSAHHHGKVAGQWETHAINALRKATRRPIVYRPKPSWDGASPLGHSTFSPPTETLADVLSHADMLVTHHSNAAIDAMVAGLPFYCEKGIAASLSTASLADVENPRRITDAERSAMLNDVAYVQWTPAEMASGKCWDHFRGML